MKGVIEIHCFKCNQRIFDYYFGNLGISIKCTRCKRVMLLKKYTEEYIRRSTINGIFKV